MCFPGVGFAPVWAHIFNDLDCNSLSTSTLPK